MGVSLSGEVARVYVGDRQVGNLYDWRLEGVDGEWTAQARKYRLDEPVAVGDFRFYRADLEIVAEGRYVTPVEADGDVHRETVRVGGSKIWVRQRESS